MAIEADKLEAFASKKKGQGDGGSGQKPPHEEPDQEAGEDVEGIEKFVPLIQLLEDSADEVEQCVDELDPTTLQDPEAEMSPEDADIMREGFDTLPGELKAELQRSLPQASDEVLAQVADHLEQEGAVDGADRLEGWLCRLKEGISTGAIGGDGDHDGGDGDEGEEDDEGEDDDEEPEGDGDEE